MARREAAGCGVGMLSRATGKVCDETLRSFGEAARTRVEQHFTEAAMVAAVERVYRSVA